MSLHQIFDAIWNYQIPWVPIIGGIVGIWAIIFCGVAILVRIVAKEDKKNAQKP